MAVVCELQPTGIELSGGDDAEFSLTYTIHGDTEGEGGAAAITALLAQSPTTYLDIPRTGWKIKAISDIDWVGTVKYSSKTNGEQDETYIEESTRIVSMSVPAPRGTYAFSGGAKLDENATISVGAIEWNIKIYRWDAYDPIDFVDYLGKINDATFRGMAAEHVYFQSAESSRKVTSAGTTAWDVELVFVWRKYTWNKFINPSTGNWEEVTPLPYETDDFDDLLP